MSSHTRLSFLLALLTAGQVSAATQTFTNSAGITVADSGTPPTVANPYPSAINVAGISGTILKLTVTLTGLSHTFPGDMDILLVAPDGKQAVIMSDVGEPRLPRASIWRIASTRSAVPAKRAPFTRKAQVIRRSTPPSTLTTRSTGTCGGMG